MGRLNGLSDGVFAFALTLLVLDIRIPEDALAGDLPAKLLEIAPRFLIYLISFIVIGGAWGSHQRMLSQIKHGDGLLVWFNLLSLLFVTLLPASATLLGRFPNAFAAIVCFAADVILIQLTALWLWRHASKHELVNPALDPRVVISIGRRLSLSAIAFGLSVPLALLNTNSVYFLWIGLFALIFTTDWLSWQQAIKTRQATIPLNGASRAHVRVRHSAGHLQITAGRTEGALVSGTFGGGLDAHISRDNDRLDVRMSTPEKQGFMSLRFPWAWGPASSLDWTFGLSSQIPIALSIETAGGPADLELGDLLVTEFSLKTSASSNTISLPAHAGQTVVNVEAGAASLIIRVPTQVAARIRADKTFAGAEINVSRFPIVDDGHEYRSLNFETAANRVDIRLSLAVGSVKII
jgi:uncharacterized membrane protein